VLLSTLLQAILHPSHHLLNVLLQIANKLGLSNKSKIIAVEKLFFMEPLPGNGCCIFAYSEAVA
jgi:hypothetical protein